MSTRRRVLLFTASLIGLTLTAGCVDPASISPDPAWSSPPSPSHTPASSLATSDCLNTSVETAHIDYTTANAASVSTLVIVGSVTSVGPAFWDTPNRARPTKIRPLRADIYRPITIALVSKIAGTASDSSVVGALSGGRVGCDVEEVKDTPSVVAGRKYVFFLQPLPDSAGVNHNDILFINDAWPVDASNVVSSSLEGKMRLADIISVVESTKMLPEPSYGPWQSAP